MINFSVLCIYLFARKENFLFTHRKTFHIKLKTFHSFNEINEFLPFLVSEFLKLLFTPFHTHIYVVQIFCFIILYCIIVY